MRFEDVAAAHGVSKASVGRISRAMRGGSKRKRGLAMPPKVTPKVRSSPARDFVASAAAGKRVMLDALEVERQAAASTWDERKLGGELRGGHRYYDARQACAYVATLLRAEASSIDDNEKRLGFFDAAQWLEEQRGVR